jgi:hypothetical protein
MSQIKLLLLLASLSCLSLHCKKEEPQKEEDKLPPLTTEGKQTFGCLMNGKAWPDSYDIDFGSSGYANGDFELYLRTLDPFTTNIKEQVSIAIRGKIFGPGHYIIPYSTNLMETNINVIYENIVYTSYVTPGGYADITIVKLDTINHLMAGTFNFLLYSPTNIVPLQVTKGRFDYKYLP